MVIFYFVCLQMMVDMQFGSQGVLMVLVDYKVPRGTFTGMY
jgi:hypothetical protein